MIFSAPYNNYFRSAYGFEDDFLKGSIQIAGVGKEVCSSHDYRHNGLLRTDVGIDNYLFQYTISGKGKIRIGQNIIDLYPGMAFFVEIPSDHEYYLDNQDKNWEFIYIMLHGEWVKSLFQRIIDSIGSIVYIEESSRLIQLLHNIYESVKQRIVKDFFEASNLAYMFLMELLRFASNVIPADYPELVKRAIETINEDYKSIDSIEALAKTLKVSGPHLIRTFSQSVGISPGQYLHRTRVEHAIILLQDRSNTLNKIAVNVGFSNGHYLGKIFHRYLGMPAEEYRNKCATSTIVGSSSIGIVSHSK